MRMKKNLEQIDSTMFRSLSKAEELVGAGGVLTQFTTGVVTDPLPHGGGGGGLDGIPDYKTDPS
jgi:hypothetical protein